MFKISIIIYESNMYARTNFDDEMVDKSIDTVKMIAQIRKVQYNPPLTSI